MSLERALASASADMGQEYQPRIFDLSKTGDAAELEGMLPSLSVFDTLEQQLGDLAAAREPRAELTSADRRSRVQRLLAGRPPHCYGRWILYPWSRRLVHVLPPEEFDELRGDRNRHKQLPSDRALFKGKTIAVAGLSVGQSAVLTLALEGIGGRYHLADFDTLALSNLNRLRAGIHELSVNKAVLTARTLFELDPYLDVRIFPDGVQETNLEGFMNGVHLLVEECDDLFMKVRLREKARELGVPVVMDTSDGGMLDIERFDLEPQRPILHGLLSGVPASKLAGLSTKDKMPYVLSTLGLDRISPSTVASLCEVKETLSTWPQLGSSVVLGGALVADASRRIFLGDLRRSGRYYVDLEQLVRDGAGAPIPPPEPLVVETVPEARVPRAPLPVPAVTTAALTSEEIRFLVAHAVMAPSGGNTQPWRFVWDGGRLQCWLDAARAHSFLDIDGLGSRVALGAAVENMTLAATRLGRSASVEMEPDPSTPDLLCQVSLGPRTNAQVSPLFELIYQRVTNRRLAPPQPLDPGDLNALRGAITLEGSKLSVVHDQSDMARVAEWAGTADRLRFLSPRMHTELINELRWTPEEVGRTRDGLDLATLDMTAGDRAVMRVLASAPAMAQLRRLGGGGAFLTGSRKVVAASSALALLSVPGVERGNYFEGGRQLQRVWLAATKRGLAVQPLGALPFLLLRLERGEGLDEEERAALGQIRGPFRQLFEIPDHHAMVLLMRISHAGPPTARALRRGLDEVLTISAPL